jgi:type VI secretion system secreted protein Hcp
VPLAEPLPLDAPGSNADATLAVVGKKQGVLKGECQTRGHEDEISLIAWRWGVSAPTVPGSAQPTGRRVYDHFEVDKPVDAASTRLLNALAHNEELRTVTLSLRKAGTDEEDFMTMTLGDARVIASRLVSSPAGGVYETVGFAFRKVEIAYHPQQRTGLRGAATLFSDELEDTP